MVKDADTRKGIANAIIHVKNVTRVARSFRRSDDINHDITSVHDGDYWRLLTPGEYEVIAVADGYEPVAKLVEVGFTQFLPYFKGSFNSDLNYLSYFRSLRMDTPQLQLLTLS